MEIEIKLRLPSPSAHQLLSDALSPFHLKTHLQHNLFFDTAAGDLASVFSALRIRFYDANAKCVLSLKSRPKLSEGVSHVEEDEEEIDPQIGQEVTANPSKMGSLLEKSRIWRRVVDEIGVADDGGEFVCLGGFRNVRAVYRWVEGLILELDETEYGFGTSYEIECETTEPERVKGLLEGFLKEKGIPYEYSGASKFAVFRSGKLLP
uniref:Adenylate cyclase n=1 Tax=Hippeastrum hybrid cultivar TaxID=679627 RepID=E1AQY1_9ASPA|nr:adenylate cyclase [Hippeastrum hybrid cultivar]